uniref:Uncharacterized protein n=1 Tax=Anguilla anguilla TaxID=7936 RepID=A0A0E9WQC7_ANGAN
MELNMYVCGFDLFIHLTTEILRPFQKQENKKRKKIIFHNNKMQALQQTQPPNFLLITTNPFSCTLGCPSALYL